MDIFLQLSVLPNLLLSLPSLGWIQWWYSHWGGEEKGWMELYAISHQQPLWLIKWQVLIGTQGSALQFPLAGIIVTWFKAWRVWGPYREGEGKRTCKVENNRRLCCFERPLLVLERFAVFEDLNNENSDTDMSGIKKRKEEMY